jgi:hypothetical protein
MILGDPEAAAMLQWPGHQRAALDEIFHRIAQRRPDAPALLDPPNRSVFTDGDARRLSYAQAERIVAAIAGRLRGMGIAGDSVIGIQLPNIVENILSVLGVMRAGMIAAPLPLLWRRADAIAALGRVGAKALITCAHVGNFNHCQFAMRIASELFSIRYVCGFGREIPDGVVPFDDLFDAEPSDPVPPMRRERLDHAAAHLGLITFDLGEGGLVPVARSHLEMLAGGLGVTLEAHLAPNACILSTMAPTSFGGMSLTLLPWLLSAGTLSLHQPFDADVLARQCRGDACGTLIVPAPVALRLADSSAFTRDGLATIIAAWQSPERLATSPGWRQRHIALVDVAIFGESGLIAARRNAQNAGGRATPTPLGPLVAPRQESGGVLVAELVATPAGTLAMRGPMVPRHAFPPGIERSGLPHFEIDRSGLVDTGYTCRIDTATKAMVVTGAPSGIVSVGGYRFRLHELQEAVKRIDGGARLVALPDPLIGRRFIGNAQKRDVVQAALSTVGVNPLVVAAFRDRSSRSYTPTA